MGMHLKVTDSNYAVCMQAISDRKAVYLSGVQGWMLYAQDSAFNAGCAWMAWLQSKEQAAFSQEEVRIVMEDDHGVV